MRFESGHRRSHQLRRAFQIPLRIAHVDVPEEGGQDGQTALRFLTGLVPSHEGVRGESVPQIVQARPVTVSDTAQTDLSGRLIERSMDRPGIQAIAPTGDKQVGGDRSSCPVTLTSCDVICQHLASRRMQGHQSVFAATPLAA
jgi:hypothetical protein